MLWPGWEGDWVPSPFTWNCHNIVCSLAICQYKRKGLKKYYRINNKEEKTFYSPPPKKKEEGDTVLILTSQWHFGVPGLITKVNEEMAEGRNEGVNIHAWGGLGKQPFNWIIKDSVMPRRKRKTSGHRRQKEKRPPNIKYGVFWELQIVQ